MTNSCNNSFKRQIPLILMILAFTVSFYGQTVAPERDDWARHSIAQGEIDSINMTNGNLGLNIPLAQLSSGRGSVSVGYNLRYNSKLYDSVTNDITIGTQTVTMEMLNDSVEGGWSYGPAVEFEIKKNGYTAPHLPPDHGQNYPLCSIKLKFFGGTTYELLPYGSGRKGNTYTCSSGIQNPASPVFYYSPDGSFIRMVIEPNGTRTVYFPDGGKVVSSPTQGVFIYDRNDNYIQSASVTLADQTQASGWVDQVGRYVAKKFISSTEDRIYAVGYNGEQLVWTVKWKSVGVRRPYRAQGAGIFREGVYNTEYCGDLRVVDEVILPSQLGGVKYVFNYHAYENYGSLDMCDPSTPNSPGFGEVKSVTLPSGAKNEYDFQINQQLGITTAMSAPQIIARSGRATTKTLTYLAEYDGTPILQTETWAYGSGATSGSTTAPDGSMTQQYHFDSVNDEGRGGSPYKTIQPNGTVIERIWLYNNPFGEVTNNADNINPYIKTEFVSIPNAAGQLSRTAIKDYEYDKNGNLLSTKEYDFVDYCAVPRSEGYCTGNPTGIPSISSSRTSENTYHNPTPNAADITSNASGSYWNGVTVTNLRAQAATEIKDGGGVPVSRSEFYYDNALTSGNITNTKSWDTFKGGTFQAYSNPLTGSNSISTAVQYDQYGNPVLMTDAKSVQTQIVYGDIVGPNGTVSGLYPTQTVAAYGTPLARTSTAVFDFYTGLTTSVTDIDNNVTSATEYDALGRPLKSIAAKNTLLEVWTRTEYDDISRRVIVRSDLETKGDGKKVAIQHYDQLGRVRLSRSIEDIATEDPYDEADGIKVQTRYQTGNPNSYLLTSNPFRAASATAATNEPTMGWTRSMSVNTGRHAETETFSGASLPAPWGSNTTSIGRVQTDTDANATTITDQAGKQRRSITNALGQLIRVDEPDTNGNLGLVSSPNQPTHYSYNTLGKMVKVNQGVQNRYFMHDSLGRLLRVRQPEQTVNTALNTSGNLDNNSWTIGFSYDNNGNLLTSRDANNVVITSTYDALNRPLTRSYSDSTPTVTYTYDDSQIPFSKGKLTKVSSSVSESRYTEFDIAGRLKQFQQYTDGQTYTSKYIYNLSGALIEEEYPSGRVVKNEFDQNGDLARIYGHATSTATERTYATGFSYFADGRIEKLKLGNGLWESAKINSRLQVTELALGYSVGNGGLMKLNYEYGELETNGTIDTTKNSGNIAKQSLTFNGLANPFVQTFEYDSLYRLSEAKETSNGNQTWRQNFGYDRYGNRTTHEKFIGTTQLTLDETVHPEIDNTTNRFVGEQGFTFDANGNLIVDAQGRQFTFNGDNKQTLVKDDQNNEIGKYFYDGEGKRIKKVIPFTGEKTIFVYSAGKLIAEYSTETPPQNPTTSYTVTDQLGSPRVIVDALGQVVSRRDFMPFGEEVDVDGTYRTTNQGYGQSDSVRQRFTGYQKDDETGLDFAEARMYQNLHGRFTAVDPLLASGKSADPQTFNRYVYVGNNPLMYVDPSGLDWLRSKERNEDGNYTYTDFRGKELKKMLKSGNWERVDFGNSKSHVIANKQGQAIYEMFAAGGGRVIELARQDSASESNDNIENFLSSFTDNYHSKSRTVRMGAAVAGVVGTCVGTVGAGCAPAIRLGTAYLEAEIEDAENARVAETVGANVHGNDLSSLRPTWLYELWEKGNDGNFLKNGITSKSEAEKRYTREYMKDKEMRNKEQYPIRRTAREVERRKNTVNPGPLNKVK